MDVGAQAGEGDSDAAAASTLTDPDSGGGDGGSGKTEDPCGGVDGSADERLSGGSEGEASEPGALSSNRDGDGAEGSKTTALAFDLRDSVSNGGADQ